MKSLPSLPQHALVIALLLTGVFFFLSAEQLPERIASHFDASGQADGWMPRSAYLRSLVGFSLFMPAFLLAITGGLRFIPSGLLNIPQSHYWYQPQNRPRLNRLFFNSGCWMSVASLGFMAGLHAAVLHANNLQPPKLDGGLIGLISVVYLLAVGITILLLLRRLMVPSRAE